MGRLTWFGHYGPRFELIRLHTPPKTVSRIWFNDLGPKRHHDLRHLAFEVDNEHPDQPSQPELPKPAGNIDSLSGGAAFFFSSCSMENVKEITICRDNTFGHRPVLGMLFWYADDSRARIGHFRFDRSLEKCLVVSGHGLHIRMKKDYMGVHVADATVNPPTDQGDTLGWTEYPWEGRLEWLFTGFTCLIRHATE